MPYKKRENRLVYSKGYYAGWRLATIYHLGNKCIICGTNKNLQIHHKNGLLRKQRSEQDLKNLEELELRCEIHHD